MDNDIAILDPLSDAQSPFLRFRSLDNITNSNSGLNTSLTKIDKTSDVPDFTPTLININSSTNIQPYGSVPLTFLQQKLPADIKIAGSSSSSSSSSSRKTSFYHTASHFLGNHGNQVRARFRSFGSSRKHDATSPQIQLTPPSRPSGRRSYFRRNRNRSHRRKADDSSRREYFLLRQQQLHLQQLQQAALDQGNSKALPPMLRTNHPRLYTVNDHLLSFMQPMYIV